MKTIRYFNFLVPSILILFFILLAAKIKMINYPFIFNFDEVNGLIIPYLQEKGYKLYEQIWYDHLPGFPWLLGIWFNFTNLTLSAGRSLVLILASLSVYCFYRILRLSCGIVAASAGTAMMITSFQYVPMAIIVKNDLPSIGFLLLSFLIFFESRKKEEKAKYILYFFSALTFVFSLEIKLSAITAIPSFLALILLEQKTPGKKIKNALIWSGFVGLIFAIFSLTFLPFSYQYSIRSHVDASEVFAAESANPLSPLISLIYELGVRYEPLYVIITIIAVAYLIFNRKVQTIIAPLLWLLFNLIRFATVSPLWPTYYIYLAIPAAWLVALFLDDLIKNTNVAQGWGQRRETKKIDYRLILVLLSGLALFAQFSLNTFRIITNRHPALQEYAKWSKNPQPHPVEKILSPFQDSGKMIITDHPHYVFKFGLNTPPETAIISRKRLETTNLDGNFILNAIERNRPDFVFIYRFEKEFLQSKDLVDYLGQNFVEYTFEGKKGKLYVAKDMEAKIPRVHQ